MVCSSEAANEAAGSESRVSARDDEKREPTARQPMARPHAAATARAGDAWLLWLFNLECDGRPLVVRLAAHVARRLWSECRLPCHELDAIGRNRGPHRATAASTTPGRRGSTRPAGPGIAGHTSAAPLDHSARWATVFVCWLIVFRWFHDFGTSAPHSITAVAQPRLRGRAQLDAADGNSVRH